MDNARAKMTEDQYKKLKKSSDNYWLIQFGATLLMMLMFGAGVVAAWGFGVGFSDPDSAGGDGLMSLLAFGLFLWCLVFLLRIRQRSTGLGQLRYTWVMRQTERDTVGNFRVASRDMAALALARKASQGQLTDDELQMLQALDVTFPYPWVVPPRP